MHRPARSATLTVDKHQDLLDHKVRELFKMLAEAPEFQKLTQGDLLIQAALEPTKLSF